MDLDLFRAWYTVVMFVIFIGIWAWAWSAKRHKAFNEAARLALDEDELPGAANKENRHG